MSWVNTARFSLDLNNEISHTKMQRGSQSSRAALALKFALDERYQSKTSRPLSSPRFYPEETGTTAICVGAGSLSSARARLRFRKLLATRATATVLPTPVATTKPPNSAYCQPCIPFDRWGSPINRLNRSFRKSPSISTGSRICSRNFSRRTISWSINFRPFLIRIHNNTNCARA